MISEARPRVQPYPWYWLWIIAAVFFGIIYLLFIRAQIPVFTPDKSVRDLRGNNNYLVLLMPSVAFNDMFAPRRIESWFTILSKSGYHPMRMSDIADRMSQGQSLPEKTIVLLFDPGFRHTFNVMAPLLAKYQFPAVWVTDDRALRRGDRRYLSRHVIKAMKNSPYWDVAQYDGSSLVVESRGRDELIIGKEGRAWVRNAGRRAFNKGIPMESLNRLHANWSWTENQLIDRLQAEQPLREKSVLTFRQIQNYKWGVLYPASLNRDHIFGLKAAIDSRTANLTWLGTRSADNLEIGISVRSLSGELWLLMRTDEDMGDHVGVCFGNGTLTVTQQRHHQNRVLSVVPLSALQQPAKFSGSIELRGSEIVMRVNDDPVVHLTTLAPSESREGLLRMTLYDKILGAAQVEGVELIVSPLSRNSPRGSIQ